MTAFRTVYLTIFVLCLWGGLDVLRANGINRNGAGAEAMGVGGAAVASPDDSFAGMSINPALLSYIDVPDLTLGFVGVIADGDYSNPLSGTGYLDESTGGFPELVARFALGEKVGLGFSIIPEQARLADWVFTDAPGGIDGNTSYGERHHRSQIIGVRTALGAGVEVTDTLSVGVSLGLVYNQNELETPYSFQSHDVLKGFKTMLDLETSGVGLNGDLGATWQPSKAVTMGLAYRTPTRIETDGTARGDIDQQFRALGIDAGSTFTYDAEVVNRLPDQLTFGGRVEATEKTALLFEVAWIGWADAFSELNVDLKNGDNATINSVLGEDGIYDTIPLDWKDVFVFRLGAEHRISDLWTLRGGYSYGESPIPNDTLLPMTAGITEHTVSLGFSRRIPRGEISFAWQYDLPASQTIGATKISSGEYLGSRVEVQAHWLAVNLKYEF